MNTPNTINGRTPEEIKRGLEYCSPRYESKHWVSCSSECPFRNEGVYCRNVLHACNKKYIQQLERERDAAVEDMRQMAMGECDECDTCRFSVETSYSAIECRRPQIIAMENNDEVEGGTLICGWQWRGVEVE